MNFNSQLCTTKEQSEMLIGFGIKKETADMVWHYTESRCKAMEWELKPHPPTLRSTTRFNIERLNILGQKNADGRVMTGEEYFDKLWGRDVPAWSLHRLVKMLPCVIDAHPTLHLTLMPDAAFYTTENNDEDHERPFSIHGNIYDNIIDCVEWLIQQGHFNEDYLV